MNDIVPNVIAGIFGAVLVGIDSWSRFDQPSYNTHSEHFVRYEPRFATSHALYRNARLAYVAANLLIYAIVSVAPGVLGVFGIRPFGENASGPTIPLFAALIIITLQNIPGLREIEQRIRSSLHTIARIPDAVRRTVAQMRGSPFSIRKDLMPALDRKTNTLFGQNLDKPAARNRLIVDDEILQTWYRCAALLIALSETHRDRSGIDPLFFDHYKDELDSINARNAALAGDVATYVADRCGGDVPDQHETVLFRDLRELRDRLYTFVACGVNSSVSTDAERFDILRKLGFGVAHPSDPINITPLLWSSLFALVVLSVFTGSSVYLFEKWVLKPLPEGWKQAFPVPKLPFEIYAWTWSTAAFYFLTIIGALAIRNTRVARRKWFDLNNLERDRPYLKYMNPIILGTLFGCVMLTVIALLGGPAFHEASISLPQLGKSVGEAVRKTLPWYPLAIVMATIAVTLSDTQLTDDRRWLRKTLVNAATGAAIMTVVGFLCAYIVITASIAAYASKINQATNDIPKPVAVAGTYLDLFIALQIGLIAFILCWFIQVFERYRTRVRSFAGKRLTIATRQGPLSVMTFDASGKAALVPTPGDEPGRPQQIREGRWQHFPEGTAVKWSAGDAGGGEVSAGRFGLISGLGGSLIYEGYGDHFIGEPEFIAQVQVSG
ncbi:MAG: hypothetical protein R3D62_07605 [Xanthobacteraceae bacterium]